MPNLYSFQEQSYVRIIILISQLNEIKYSLYNRVLITKYHIFNKKNSKKLTTYRNMSVKYKKNFPTMKIHGHENTVSPFRLSQSISIRGME